jgi:hypothetical protein
MRVDGLPVSMACPFVVDEIIITTLETSPRRVCFGRRFGWQVGACLGWSSSGGCFGRRRPDSRPHPRSRLFLACCFSFSCSWIHYNNFSFPHFAATTIRNRRRRRSLSPRSPGTRAGPCRTLGSRLSRSRCPRQTLTRTRARTPRTLRIRSLCLCCCS